MLVTGAPRSATAAPPQVVGPGCTTAFFLDPLCKGVGVGVKSSGIYTVAQGQTMNTPGIYTMGNRPDPDPTDPAVKTTGDWQAKWGIDNAGMINFLSRRKRFTNTSRIFYIAQSGNDATGAVNDPKRPYRSMAPIMAKLRDLQGGAVIIRGGRWTDLDFNACKYSHGNPCFSLSGSKGHPLYLLAYPGEVVQTDIPFHITLTYKPAPDVCCVTIDGVEFRAAKYGIGDGVSLINTTNFTFVNDEFAGWHQTFFGNHTVNLTVKSSVFHDMMYHAVYWGDNTPMGGHGDFDFVSNARLCVNGSNTTPCASSNARVIGNVMYANGASGYEPIHLNTYLNGATVRGNIVSFSGGSAIALQTGVYHALIDGNIFFDNGRDCITLYLYDHGIANQAATLRWNTIENNICYVGAARDHIRGTSPGGGIVQRDNTQTPGHYIKNTIIRNNIIVTDNRGPGWSGVPFRYERNSYPHSDIIRDNVIWSSVPGANAEDRIMAISGDADPTGLGGGNYNFSQFQAFSHKFNGNLYADPRFNSASPEFTLTPGAFNFNLLPTSPAIHAGPLAKFMPSHSK